MLLPEYEESSSESESEADEDIPLTDRLLDDGERASADEAPQMKKRLLPDASELFEQIDRPSFLNPEANKRNKVCAAHVIRQPTAEAAAQQQRQQQAEARAKEADISKMAPKLKGQPDTQAVLSAPAQRRTEPAGGKKPALIGNGALIAMMGGGGHVDQKDKAKGARATHATTVEDALAEPSATQLPRHKQDRKNKEKSKRAMGQSSHSQWKSEAEMVLRQQFDS